MQITIVSSEEMDKANKYASLIMLEKFDYKCLRVDAKGKSTESLSFEISKQVSRNRGVYVQNVTDDMDLYSLLNYANTRQIYLLVSTNVDVEKYKEFYSAKASFEHIRINYF